MAAKKTTTDKADSKLSELREKAAKLRMGGRTKNVRELRALRKEIARALTVQNSTK